MPELPDLETYLAALEARTLGSRLGEIRLTSPFLLRSVRPPLKAARGRRVVSLRRLGKRLVFELEDELFLVLHLMIAGRLRWKPRGAKPCPAKRRARRLRLPHRHLDAHRGEPEEARLAAPRAR